jgi:hypothetical protein
VARRGTSSSPLQPSLPLGAKNYENGTSTITDCACLQRRVVAPSIRSRYQGHQGHRLVVPGVIGTGTLTRNSFSGVA